MPQSRSTPLALIAIAALLGGCRVHRTAPAARAGAPAQRPSGITPIDARDTAAYAEAGAEAVAAIARCKPPACRPDIFRGPGDGELTVGLDSAAHPGAEVQWHGLQQAVPGGAARQDSLWGAMLSKWEAQRPPRLLLIDGVPRSFAYAREHVRMADVSSLREVAPKEAKALSHDPAAANGGIVITTATRTR